LKVATSGVTEGGEGRAGGRGGKGEGGGGGGGDEVLTIFFLE